MSDRTRRPWPITIAGYAHSVAAAQTFVVTTQAVALLAFLPLMPRP